MMTKVFFYVPVYLVALCVWHPRVIGMESPGSGNFSPEEEERCVICFDGLNEVENELVRLLHTTACCKRVFHHDCIHRWLNKTSTCPWCRAVVKAKEKGFFYEVLEYLFKALSNENYDENLAMNYLAIEAQWN